MSKDTNIENGNFDGSYVVKKSKKSSILAFIFCFLIAFFIWAYTMSYGSDKPSGTTDIESTEQTA